MLSDEQIERFRYCASRDDVAGQLDVFVAAGLMRQEQLSDGRRVWVAQPEFEQVVHQHLGRFTAVEGDDVLPIR